MVWGDAIAAGANIAGGLLNRSAANRATDAMRENSAAQLAAQQQFAQMGIRWRVDDAKKAGIHPLYALGASIPAYNPSPISISGDNSMGNALASAGQEIGRAVQAKSTQAERAELLELQKDQLRAQIARTNAATALDLSRANPQLPPPLPNPLAQHDPMNPPDATNLSSGVEVVPHQPRAAAAHDRSTVTGGSAGADLVRIGPDSYQKAPNKDVYGEEFTAPGMAGWYVEQQLRPKPPSWQALRRNHPSAIGWVYNRLTRTFRPAYKRTSLPGYQKFFPLPGIPHPRPRVPHKGGRRNKHGNSRWGGIER